jgi:hypothetical protein
MVIRVRSVANWHITRVWEAVLHDVDRFGYDTETPKVNSGLIIVNCILRWMVMMIFVYEYGCGMGL